MRRCVSLCFFSPKFRSLNSHILVCVESVSWWRSTFYGAITLNSYYSISRKIIMLQHCVLIRTYLFMYRDGDTRFVCLRTRVYSRMSISHEIRPLSVVTPESKSISMLWPKCGERGQSWSWSGWRDADRSSFSLTERKNFLPVPCSAILFSGDVYLSKQSWNERWWIRVGCRRYIIQGPVQLQSTLFLLVSI